MPSESTGGPSTNSIIRAEQALLGNGKSLSEKIREWLPGHHSVHAPDSEMVMLPDWTQEFWTPIDVDVSEDPMVILCKLNFQQYFESPHSSPMFRDLEGKSRCMGTNRRREKMSVLLEEIKSAQGTPAGHVIAPSGFVFHESRVGSTLIANLLASDPYALVFSESTPIANAILHCTSCSHEQHVQLFRNVLTLMGRSPIHTKLFVKFQSITTTKIQIALEAFPETPWAFVFRQPVQTMMSHLDPAKGSNSAPCLRSKRSPPSEVRDVIDKFPGARNTNDAWCAAHLNMLCTFALRAYSNYNSTPVTLHPRALLINYDSLPGIVPKALLPLFGVQPSESLLRKMEEESKHYSKSRGSVFRLFFGDSQDKDKRSTPNIQLYGEKILGPSYQQLNQLAIESFARLEITADTQAQLITEHGVDWKSIQSIRGPAVLKDIEAIAGIRSGSSGASNSRRGFVSEDIDVNQQHSHVLKTKEFEPWAPFANHHSSQPVERVPCPMIPAPGYPKAYSMLDIVKNWNTDDTTIPPFHYDSLCHFDYSNASQLQAAYAYRERELPFIMYNIPELDEVVKRWNDLDYLSQRLGSKKYRTEASESNHFMYWRGGGGNNLRGKKAWSPPTSIVNYKFEDWLEVAVKGQNKSLAERTHRYFRVSSDMGNDWLFNELPFFKPVKSIFMVSPKEQRGIHCRFGMRSVIAEAHFDGSRNAVVEIGGLRRWIMTHPDQCKHMHMLPPSHPSGRHSAVDWSKPDLETYPNFAKVVGNEVILQPGDFLFVPTFWIHYIVSLNVNFQCNTRSGTFQGYNKHIKECGF